MEPNRSSSDAGRRLAQAYAAQAGSLAVLVETPEFPAAFRIQSRRVESGEQRLSGLEALRHTLVQAVLDARELCERTASKPLAPEPDAVALALGSAPVLTAPTFGQLLLSAAVKDLEELDDRLHQARLAD
ncbi:hypothetical protein [Arthrobacter sp. H20]|uniref:hypothetical protein n=1 Tax=Arthrobacter sp. H20 TaxID=1267981 RepID=UPI0004796E48|nr:hypothetical protein [Arthrobacter sp. H20]